MPAEGGEIPAIQRVAWRGAGWRNYGVLDDEVRCDPSVVPVVLYCCALIKPSQLVLGRAII